MPWTAADAERHTKKADTAELQSVWANVANSEREKLIKVGASESVADGIAIKEANRVVAKTSKYISSRVKWTSDSRA
jgi:hypothetical protein